MVVRVLWLTKGLGRGGAERLLVSAIPYVDRSRFNVEIAYLLPWKDAFRADFERAGMPVHCLGSRRHLELGWLVRLRRLVRTREIDIVHAHLPYPAIGARLALGRSGPPVVYTEHNIWERYRVSTRWANRLTYRRNAAVIAVSHAVADSICSHRPASRPEVVLHGADLRAVRSDRGAGARGRALLGLRPDDLVVGTVGNFTAKKDHRTLLTAVADLVPGHPRIKLVLVGSGPLEHDLRQLAASLHLDSHVCFPGSRDDVFDLLPAFDVFALSSLHEGLPIALLEAMANGVPCVATHVGGIPEVVSDGQDGSLVPTGDPGALGAALGKLLDDGRLRSELGQAGASRAAAFDLGSAIRRIERLYDEVLSSR